MKPGSLKPGDRVFVFDEDRPKWRGLAVVCNIFDNTNDGLNVNMDSLEASEDGNALIWWEECYATEEDYLRAVILHAAGVKAGTE